MRITPLIEVELDCAPGSAVDFREQCGLDASAVCTGALVELMLVTAAEVRAERLELRDLVLSGHAPIGDGIRVLGRAYDGSVEVIAAPLACPEQWRRTEASASLEASAVVEGLPAAMPADGPHEPASDITRAVAARAGGAIHEGFICDARRHVGSDRISLEVDAGRLPDIAAYALHPLLWEAGVALAELLQTDATPSPPNLARSLRAAALCVYARGTAASRIDAAREPAGISIAWRDRDGGLVAALRGLQLTAAARKEPGLRRAARIAAHVLGRSFDDARLSFTELGVSSIDRARAAAALAADYGVRPALEAIMACGSIADVASAFESEPAPSQVDEPRAGTHAASGASDRYVLSPAQRQVWALQAMTPDLPRCHVHVRLRCRGALDEAALRAALCALLARHESLRVAIDCSGDEPLQRVLPSFEVPLDIHDLTHAPEEQRGAALLAASDAHARAPFDLERGPLVRFALVALAIEDHALLITVHHLIVDGFGIELMVRELLELYEDEGAFAGALVPLSRLAERPPTKQEHAPSGIFKARDSGRRLALARDPDGSGPGRGARAAIEVPRELRTAAQRAQVSTFSLLCSVYGRVIASHAGQDELTIGVISAARTTVEQLGAVGMFARSVPLHVAVGEGASLLDTAREIHARVPGLAMQTASAAADGTPFAVTALFQQWSDAPLRTAGLSVQLELDSPDGAPEGYCRSELELLVMDYGNELSASLQYDRSVFREVTVRWLASAIGRVLREACALPPEPADALILRGAARAIDEPFVHRRIARRALERPDAIAVRDGYGAALTFRALEQRVRAVARGLVARGAAPGRAIGIVAERVADLPVAVLAVLESGAAYVPIDPEHPRERVDVALTESCVALVVTLTPTDFRAETAEVVTCDELAAIGATVPPSSAAPSRELQPSDAAYVLYTSGSTGKPKGVVVEHASLSNFVTAMEVLLSSSALGPWLALTTLAFDISVVELLYALAAGAETRVGTAPSQRSDDSEPFGALRALGKGVRCFQCTPSLARLLLADTEGRAFLGGLSVLLVGGEALPLWLSRSLCEVVPGELHNMYGPTETTVWSSSSRVYADAAWVPIGEPLLNTTLRVVDERGSDVAPGLSGELWIAGAGVARGYVGRPEETASRFVASSDGERFYRTGDLVRARELADGARPSRTAIEWLGRIDRQVKLAGNRIELGEIEGVLTQHPFTRECAAIIETVGSEERLVVVVVPDEASMADAAGGDAVTGIYSAEQIEGVLLAWAAHKLPQYMVPARVVLADALARTSSGKTDHRALRALLERRPPPEALRPGEHPVTREEKRLAALWCDVLARATVGRYDDFFALGGTSFTAVLLASRARQRGIALAPAVVLAHPTLAEQALQISAVVVQREARAMQEDAELEPLENASANAEWPPRCIVLTGATGFLGAHLLAELHARLDAEVVCLVRAQDDDAARERLRQSAVKWGIEDRVQWSLTRCVAADLRLSRFGLSEEEWQFLGERADLVLHNAAEVNFALGYEELRGTNVVGTRTAIALAAQGKRKPLHYVSTIAITDASAAGERVDEDSVLSHAERLVDGYSQSKWVAEKLVRRAGEQGLSVACYRAGPLIADRAPNGDAFAEALATVARTGVSFSSRGRALPHLSRVDDTARAIVMLVLAREQSSSIEHVVSPQRLPIADLLGWVREWGFEVRELSDAEWLERMDDEPWAAATMFVVSQRLRDGLPLVPEVEHGATLVRLTALGFAWRDIDGVLIQRLIARLTATSEKMRPASAG